MKKVQNVAKSHQFDGRSTMARNARAMVAEGMHYFVLPFKASTAGMILRVVDVEGMREMVRNKMYRECFVKDGAGICWSAPMLKPGKIYARKLPGQVFEVRVGLQWGQLEKIEGNRGIDFERVACDALNSDAGLLFCNEWQLVKEKNEDGYTPDIVGKIGNREIWVEVKGIKGRMYHA